MKSFALLVLIFLTVPRLWAQAEDGHWVVVTIEKASSNRLHKRRTDYWLVSRDLWSKGVDNAMFPLYVAGFSTTDYQECCTDKELVLFNPVKGESYTAGPNQETLLRLIAEKRKKIQTIRKQWVFSKHETVTVYLTPINGAFCLCAFRHVRPQVETGYAGPVAVPVAAFVFDATFWESKEREGLVQVDYSELPFMSLQTAQY